MVTGNIEEFKQISRRQNDRYISDYGEKAVKAASRYENKLRKDRASYDRTPKIKEQLIFELSNDARKYNEVLTSFNAMMCKSEEPIVHMSEDDAVNELTTNNWFSMELDKGFQCIYYPENKAWISKNKHGYHRYFSKNLHSCEWFCLSIIDMFQVFNGYTYKEALTSALDYINITCGNEGYEEEWRKKQIGKYVKNIEIIEHANIKISNYYNLNMLIRKHLHVLLKMNLIGHSKVDSMYNNYKYDSVFFASSSYIGNFFEVNKGNVNKILNMFAVLGLLTRVPEVKLPVPMREKAIKEMKNKNKQYLVSFYTVPCYTDEILREANRIAGILLENKVRASTITIEKIEKIFGSDEADSVYLNTRIHAKAINKKAMKKVSKKAVNEIDADKVAEVIFEEIPF